ncbi:MAG: type II toxin-antitoxin system Phd/YefM family antitoxin [Propylenella sp.]
MWSVQDAKARLSEVMRRARKGEPQFIGTREPCVLVSADQFQAARPGKHLGRFLVETAPRGAPIELPPRGADRGDPFSES